MADRHHPFWKRDDSFKYIYCFGLGVMSMGHMKSITETQDDYNYLLAQISLPEEKKKQIFIDINNHFEQRIDQVFSCIRTKEAQYCFVLDLYHILSLTSWARPYCSQVLEDYLQIFQFSAVERIFFQEFNKARKEQNLEYAVKAYQCFAEEGYAIRYDFLTWFYPEFTMEEQYQEIHISAGKTLILDKPTKIQGDITVERGGSLLIHGAVIEMQGCVMVQGGRIQIDHADIHVLACNRPFWLTLENTAVVTIVDTVIDCHTQCGVLCQNAGRLLVEDSWFRNTDRMRAILFSGQSIRLYHTRFWQGQCGSVELNGAAHAKIINCEFRDACAEYGGAIRSESIGDIFIQQCTFLKCRAKYLGSAVYFKHQKLGQNVEDCRCSGCVPEDNAFFNILRSCYDNRKSN